MKKFQLSLVAAVALAVLTLQGAGAAAETTQNANLGATKPAGAADSTISVTRSRGYGCLRVNLYPESVRSSARFIVCGYSFTSGTTLTMTPGYAYVAFTDAYGYTKPGSGYVKIVSGMTAVVSATYKPAAKAQLCVVLNPASIRSSARFVVGGYTYRSGTVLEGAPGTYRVAFTPVSGYSAPNSVYVTLKAGYRTTLTAPYTANSRGVLVTNLYPSAVRNSGRFVINGTRYVSGTALSLRPGTYKVYFTSVYGFVAPNACYVTIKQGYTTTLSARYGYRTRGGSDNGSATATTAEPQGPSAPVTTETKI